MTKTYESPLVGAHFRPPAKAVIEHLPAGAILGLEPEPGNPYDEGAIRVIVDPRQVAEPQRDGLREMCWGMGEDWDALLESGEPIHLGYVISAGNKKLGGWTPNTVIGEVISRPGWRATLGFGPSGEPLVLTTVVEPEGEPEAEDEVDVG